MGGQVAPPDWPRVCAGGAPCGRGLQSLESPDLSDLVGPTGRDAWLVIFLSGDPTDALVLDRFFRERLQRPSPERDKALSVGLSAVSAASCELGTPASSVQAAEPAAGTTLRIPSFRNRLHSDVPEHRSWFLVSGSAAVAARRLSGDNSRVRCACGVGAGDLGIPRASFFLALAGNISER